MHLTLKKELPFVRRRKKCNKFIRFGFFLVDSDFRNGLFKLTAMLIHNIDTDENESELIFTAIGGAPNTMNIQKGIINQIYQLLIYELF